MARNSDAIRLVDDGVVYRPRDNIIFNVGKLANSYARQSARFYLREYGMSVPEVRVLNVIGSHPAIAAADVVTLSMMDKGLVSRSLARLEKRGLVTRRPDESDARRSVLILSREGAQVDERVVKDKARRHGEAVGPLSAGEEALFYRLLVRLQGQAEIMEAREDEAADSVRPDAL